MHNHILAIVAMQNAGIWIEGKWFKNILLFENIQQMGKSLMIQDQREAYKLRTSI